ncbi:MAG: hypothetical protein JXB47_12995 [Anaerolineae bacterium]|nr:hypothetical protein [Anaerolineae bacterium]
MFVDLWGWFDSFYFAAVRAGDHRRQEMVQLYRRAWRYLETDPPQGLALFEQGRALADQLDEPCWRLFFDYWCCEAQVFYLDDLNTGLTNAVRLVVEARKPHYSACPILGRVYRILLDVYVFIDPVGYEDKICETLAHMERDIPLDHDTYCLLEARRVALALALDRFKEAEELSFSYLARSEPSTFRKSHAYSLLAYLNYLRGDFALALEYIEASEQCARRVDIKASVAQGLAWQALLSRRRGDELAAQSFYRQATAQMAQLGRKPSGMYYDALCDYHEFGGDADHALRLRDRQIDDIRGTGELFAECEYRLGRCRLLGRMGQPLTSALTETREVAARLLKPAHFLAKVARVEAGDYTDPLRMW